MDAGGYPCCYSAKWDISLLAVVLGRAIEERGKERLDEATKVKLYELCRTALRSVRLWNERWPQHVARNQSPSPLSGHAISQIITLSIELDDKNMFLEAYPLCRGIVPVPTFRAVGMALVRYELLDLLPK